MYVYHGVKSISWISVSYTHVCMWTVKAGKMNDFAQWHVTMSYGWHIKIKILAGLLPGELFDTPRRSALYQLLRNEKGNEDK